MPALLPCTYLYTSILRMLEGCIYGGRECTTPWWQRKLKEEWWNRVVPYFLYASACGSLSAVEYFIASGQEPTIRYLLSYYANKIWQIV